MSIDRIAESLGVQPLEEVVQEEPEEIVEVEPSTEITVAGTLEVAPGSEIAAEHLKEVEKTRDRLDTALDVGKDALGELFILAKQGENPRAYEAMIDMIRVISTVSKDYIDIAEKKRYVKEEIASGVDPTKVNNNPTVIQNNLVLSTKDLLATIQDMGKK